MLSRSRHEQSSWQHRLPIAGRTKLIRWITACIHSVVIQRRRRIQGQLDLVTALLHLASIQAIQSATLELAYQADTHLHTMESLLMQLAMAALSQFGGGGFGGGGFGVVDLAEVAWEFLRRRLRNADASPGRSPTPRAPDEARSGSNPNPGSGHAGQHLGRNHLSAQKRRAEPPAGHDHAGSTGPEDGMGSRLGTFDSGQRC